jgi:hypothetical protein
MEVEVRPFFSKIVKNPDMIVQSDEKQQHKATKEFRRQEYILDEKESKDTSLILSLLKSGYHVLVSGVAGSGKSTILKEMVRLGKKKLNIQVVSYTGIACINLGDFAQTIHSFFCISPMKNLTEFNSRSYAFDVCKSTSKHKQTHFASELK